MLCSDELRLIIAPVADAGVPDGQYYFELKTAKEKGWASCSVTSAIGTCTRSGDLSFSVAFQKSTFEFVFGFQLPAELTVALSRDGSPLQSHVIQPKYQSVDPGCDQTLQRSQGNPPALTTTYSAPELGIHPQAREAEAEEKGKRRGKGRGRLGLELGL